MIIRGKRLVCGGGVNDDRIKTFWGDMVKSVFSSLLVKTS